MVHAAALRRFELDNREFFARQIPDRGDDYFEQFEQRLAALVAENDSGRSLLCVVVDDAAIVLGRINLTDIDDPAQTELGYRVAETACGRGVATWGVAAVLQLAVQRGVGAVSARVATDNPASMRVLEHCGFAPIGPVDAPVGSPRNFVGYRWPAAGAG